MGSVIRVTRDQLEAAMRSFQKLAEASPRWQFMHHEFRKRVAEENARRDAAYAMKQASTPAKAEEAADGA